MEPYIMYSPAVNSPAMFLAGALTASGTEANVVDASPYSGATLPVPLTVGTGEGAETVLCTAITGNTLTIQRALEGKAASWPAGTAIARNFCALDHKAMEDNILMLCEGKAEKDHAARHASGGEDPLTPESIGAESSGAAEAVQRKLDEHTGNTDVHITAEERTAWYGKADGSHAGQHEAFGDDEISHLNLDFYNERVETVTGTVINFDLSPVIAVTVSGDTTFTSVDCVEHSGYSKSGILLLTTGLTAPTITFPSNITWTAESEINANSLHEIVFRKYPGYDNWIASVSATVSLVGDLLG